LEREASAERVPAVVRSEREASAERAAAVARSEREASAERPVGRSLASTLERVDRRPPRLSSEQYVGLQRIFFTMCTFGRLPLFIAAGIVDPVREQLLHDAVADRVEIIAYCFMPDHLHVLVEALRADCDLRRLARVFKQRSSFQWKRRAEGDLWQRSYFEHVLRDDEDTFQVARYILDNPVRAGMVKNPEDYPFLGSLTMNVRDLLYSVQIDQRPT
jgi:putative transposase